MAREGADVLQSEETGNTPIRGAAILLIVGEPHRDEHRDLILAEITKGFRCWDQELTGIDLNEELAAIANKADLGEEGPDGERVIRHESSNFGVEILINPQTQTVRRSLKLFFSTPTKHRSLIYAGLTFIGDGAWILHDDTYTFKNFVHTFKDCDVENALKQQKEGTLYIHCQPHGEWTESNVSKHEFSKHLTVKVNPEEKVKSLHGALQFTAYLHNFIKYRPVTELLQESEIMGNIRFTRPTLYIFPGCQGDSSLFGISGFNLLINGGYSRKACFWDFTRNLDRIDAMLLTHLGTDNLFGVSSVFERKSIENVHPEIGFMYWNGVDGIKQQSSEENKNGDSLAVNLAHKGSCVIKYAVEIGQQPRPCFRSLGGPLAEPVNLYHKVGHGSLDMFVLNPIQDSKEMKDFYQQWNQQVSQFGSQLSVPLPNALSICALLVWRPANPNEKITRILFPGNAPQYKVIEGLERVKHLDYMKHSTCCEKDLKSKPSAAPTKKLPLGVSKSKPSATRTVRATISPTKTDPPKKLEVKKTERPKPTTLSKTNKVLKEDTNKKTSKEKTDKPKSVASTPSKSSSKSSSPSKETTPVRSPIKASTPIKGKEVPKEIAVESPKEVPLPTVVAEAPVDLAAQEVLSSDPVVNHIDEPVVEDAIPSIVSEPVHSEPLPMTEPVVKPASPAPLPDPEEYDKETEAKPAVDMTKQGGFDKQQLAEMGIYDEDTVENEFPNHTENGLEDPQEIQPQALPDPVVPANAFSVEPDVISDVAPTKESTPDLETDKPTDIAMKEPDIIPSTQQDEEEINVTKPEASASVSSEQHFEPDLVQTDEKRDDMGMEMMKVETSESVSSEQHFEPDLLQTDEKPDNMEMDMMKIETSEPVSSEQDFEPDFVHTEEKVNEVDMIKAEASVPVSSVPLSEPDLVHTEKQVEEEIDMIKHEMSEPVSSSIPSLEPDLVQTDEKQMEPSQDADQGAELDHHKDVIPGENEISPDISKSHVAPDTEDTNIAEEAMSKPAILEDHPDIDVEKDDSIDEEENKIEDVGSFEVIPERGYSSLESDQLRQPKIGNEGFQEEETHQEVSEKFSDKPVEDDEFETKDIEQNISENTEKLHDGGLHMAEDVDDLQVAAHSYEEKHGLEAAIDDLESDEIQQTDTVNKEIAQHEVDAEQLSSENEAEVKEGVILSCHEDDQLQMDAIEKKDKLSSELDQQQASELEKGDIHSQHHVKNELPSEETGQHGLGEQDFSREEEMDQDAIQQVQQDMQEIKEIEQQPDFQEKPLSPTLEGQLEFEPKTQLETERAELPVHKLINEQRDLMTESFHEDLAQQDVFSKESPAAEMEEQPAFEEEFSHDVKPQEFSEETSGDDLMTQDETKAEVDDEEIKEQCQLEEQVSSEMDQHSEPEIQQIGRAIQLDLESEERSFTNQEHAIMASDTTEITEQDVLTQKFTELSEAKEEINFESDQTKQVPVDTHLGQSPQDEYSMELQKEQSPDEKDFDDDEMKPNDQDTKDLKKDVSEQKVEDKINEDLSEKHTVVDNVTNPFEEQTFSSSGMESGIIDMKSEETKIMAEVEDPVCSEPQDHYVYEKNVDISDEEVDDQPREQIEIQYGSKRKDVIMEEQEEDEEEEERRKYYEREISPDSVDSNDSNSDIDSQEEIVDDDDDDQAHYTEQVQYDSLPKDHHDDDDLVCIENGDDDVQALEVSNIPEAFEKDITPNPDDQCWSRGNIQTNNRITDVTTERFQSDEEDDLDHREDTDSIDGGTPDSDKDIDESFGQASKRDIQQSPHSDVEHHVDPVDNQTELSHDKWSTNPFDSPEQVVLNPFHGIENQTDPHAHTSPAKTVDQFDDSLEVNKNHPTSQPAFNPLQDWGEPMGLPAPPPPSANGSEKTDTKKADKKPPSSASSKPKVNGVADKPKTSRVPADKKPDHSKSTTASDKLNTSRANRSTVGSSATDRLNTSRLNKSTTEKKEPAKSATSRLNVSKTRPATASKTDKTDSRPKSAPAGRKPMTGSRASPAAVKTPPLPPHTTFFVDLTYIPNHGNPNYSDIEFFKRIRARYYVLSALSPNPQILNSLLDAKQTWEDKEAEVTVIPTYDNDTLRHWMGLHKDQLSELKIDVAPSASRCTIQLQDHETASSAYRLEF